jgi:hypothetical protein
MSDEADHVRALKFAGPILAEVLRAVARQRRCGVTEIAGAEVLELDTAILRGIQTALARGYAVPDVEPPPAHSQRPTGRPSNVYERPTKRPPPPLGALGPGQRTPTMRGTPVPPPPWPPTLAGSPSDDVTPAHGTRAKRRREERGK